MGLKGLAAGWKRFFAANRAVATVLVTVLTVLLVGGVLAATTSLACGPLNQLKLKVGRCVETSNTAALQTPTPTIFFPPPQPLPSAPASALPPPTNPPSPLPPVPTPASAITPQDPFYPGASGTALAPALNCRLAVFAGPPGSGGFVVFPGGSFIADPRSAVTLPSPSPGSPSPAPGQGPGPGYGGYQPGGMTYDAAVSKWLAVGPSSVAPDGKHYAYPSTNSIYVVDASTDIQTEVGAGHTWFVLRVLNDRVYATVPNTPGFWVVPFSGTPSQVTSAGYWQGASAVAAYGTATSAVPQGATQKMLKLDVATGKVIDWFSDSGATLNIYGFDRVGNPLIMANYNNGWALWLTTGPTNATVIANSTMTFYIQNAPFADSHGIWIPVYFQSSPGFLLYVSGSGLYWMTSFGAQLAGGCD
jgi:hypothetical protein